MRGVRGSSRSALGSQGQAGVTGILSGLRQGNRVIVYSSAQLRNGARVREQKVDAAMINLAGRDIANHFGRYLLTGLGLGLLIGVTLTMAGVYRGMVDDGKALIAASRRGYLGGAAEHPRPLRRTLHLAR